MDASLVGLGAVLTQKYVHNRHVVSLPVAFASRSLNKAERNYGVTDRERVGGCVGHTTL